MDEHINIFKCLSYNSAAAKYTELTESRFDGKGNLYYDTSDIQKNS